MTLRDRLLESGVFLEPGALGWSGDWSRQATAPTRATLPASRVLAHALVVLARLAALGNKDAQTARNAIDSVVSTGDPLGPDVGVEIWVWLTLDAFGEAVRLDVLGEEEAPPPDLRGTRERP